MSTLYSIECSIFVIFDLAWSDEANHIHYKLTKGNRNFWDTKKECENGLKAKLAVPQKASEVQFIFDHILSAIPEREQIFLGMSGESGEWQNKIFLYFINLFENFNTKPLPNSSLCWLGRTDRLVQW